MWSFGADFLIAYIFPAIAAAEGWKTVARHDDNYARRRVHVFEPVRSDRLRITVLETNGNPTARIYEVRIYNNP